MEDLNNVPSSGTYGVAINEVNHNFGLVKVAIDGLEARTIRSKGLFQTAAALNATYPSPIVGDYAYVGSGLPAEIYVCVTAGTWIDSGQTGGSETINLGDYSTTTQMNAAIDSGLQGQVGYAVCSTDGGTARKDVVVSGFKLLANGGALHIKMTTANTNASATMNISPTSTVVAANTKPLFYNGEQATAENTWEANEILSIYYDGTNYQATNSQGGGGKAEKIKYNNSQSGLEATNAQGAIDELANEMPTLYGSVGTNTDGSMTQAAISEMVELKSLFRSLTFPKSSSGSFTTDFTGFAAGDYIIEVSTPVEDGITATLRLRQSTSNNTDIKNIPFDGNTHEYHISRAYTTTRFYMYFYANGSTASGTHGPVGIKVYTKISDYSRLDSIPYDVSAYNNSEMFTLDEAIAAIPIEKQQIGMLLKFINPNKEYSVYKFIGTSVADITNKVYWNPVSGSEAEFKGDLEIELQGKYSMGEYRIYANEASTNFGVALSQSSSVWATPHIKCKGYDYLYVNLYPSSNSDFYNCGCVFYDAAQQPIHGYGSMAFQAASTNDGNPCYPFPRCLEIPTNAITFRTTYRKSQYPKLKLIRGNWDKIPLGARYVSEYYGERIELRKSHTVYLSHWTRYSSGLSTNQGGCAYGNYLFLFGQENRFSVVDFSNPAGAAKTPVQSNIAIPNMKTSDGNSVIHNDAVGFSDVFYDSNDEFPLLVCGGGYGENATGTTYFYVIRIVREGNTFTPTVVQEITVISGIPEHLSCLNFFYDTDRHVIIASGKGGYTWVTKYNISATAGNFTIDLRDSNSYTRLFYNAAGSGSYYNNHLFAANELTVDGASRIGFKCLNVITGEFQRIPLARHFEPEAVFAWNDELYLLEVGNVFKLYFD